MPLQTPEFQEFMNFLTSQVQKEYEQNRGELATGLSRRGVFTSPYGTQPLQKLQETTAASKTGLVATAGWQEYLRGITREQQVADVAQKRTWEQEDWEKQAKLAREIAEMTKPRQQSWQEMFLPALGQGLGTGLGMWATGGLGALGGASKVTSSNFMANPKLNLWSNVGR